MRLSLVRRRNEGTAVCTSNVRVLWFASSGDAPIAVVAAAAPVTGTGGRGVSVPTTAVSTMVCNATRRGDSSQLAVRH